MGQKPFPYPAALVVGFLSADPELVASADKTLSSEFGPAEAEVAPFPFTHSDYYEKEMGRGLSRCWKAYAKLCRRESLAQLKHFTIELENSFILGDPRRVNIDPGLLTLENFALATTKNFSIPDQHRSNWDSSL